MKRTIALLAALAALAFVAAGCGDGDGDESGGETGASAGPSSSGELTREEFLEQGNEICKEGNEELQSGIAEFGEENGLSGNEQPTAAQIEDLIAEVVIPAMAEQVDELRALGAPRGGEVKAFERYLDRAEAAVEKVEADPSSLTGGASSPFAESNAEAAALGLVVCAQEI